MVNGLAFTPPFCSVGASTSRSEATKFPFGSVCISLGITCSQAVHGSHDALAHDVIGLRHSGHCSAANTALPPCFWAGAALPLVPPLLELLQAAATSAIANRTVSQRR